MSGSWVTRLLFGGVAAVLTLTAGAAAFVPDEVPVAPESTSSPAPAAPESSAPANPSEVLASGTVPLDPDDFLTPLELPPPTEPPGVPSEQVSGPPALESVDGIVVHARLAPLLRTLLAEADMAGLDLGGGGHRDRAAQARLRAQNCPDPVASPAEACSPPTARVGESLHEYGLAIDFTVDGSLLLDREHPAYRFLDANSAWTGLVPHPSEPWHWSYRG